MLVVEKQSTTAQWQKPVKSVREAGAILAEMVQG